LIEEAINNQELIAELTQHNVNNRDQV